MIGIIDFLDTNKEWLFSGIGVFVIGGIISWRLKKNMSEPNLIQTIGNNSSNNNQAGHDIKDK